METAVRCFQRKMLYEVFSDSLGIPLTEIVETLAYSEHPRWDSTAHLQLVMALENRFGFTLEMQDMLDMSSVREAARILEKYDIQWC